MDGNTGGRKRVGGIGLNPVLACAAPSAIGSKPMHAAGDVVALVAAAADDSS